MSFLFVKAYSKTYTLWTALKSQWIMRAVAIFSTAKENIVRVPGICIMGCLSVLQPFLAGKKRRTGGGGWTGSMWGCTRIDQTVGRSIVQHRWGDGANPQNREETSGLSNDHRWPGPFSPAVLVRIASTYQASFRRAEYRDTAIVRYVGHTIALVRPASRQVPGARLARHCKSSGGNLDVVEISKVAEL